MTTFRSVFTLLLALCSVPATYAQAPGPGVAGQGLAGHWQGSLKASPVIELRLVLEIERAANGSLSGAMISVDQGGVRIPLTALTESNGAVHIEAGGTGEGPGARAQW